MGIYNLATRVATLQTPAPSPPAPTLAMASDLQSFRQNFKGDVVTEDHPDYEASITRWALNSIRRAKVVAFVKDASDVALAIQYAKSAGLPIAIRSGGHGASGSSSIEGGLVVDLSRHLNKVTVDPESRLAYVQGGALWRTVDETAIKHGLATVAGTVSHVRPTPVSVSFSCPY